MKSISLAWLVQVCAAAKRSEWTLTWNCWEEWVETCCCSLWPALRLGSCIATWCAGNTWRLGWPAGSWWWPRGRRPPPCAGTSGPRPSSGSAYPVCYPSKALSVTNRIHSLFIRHYLKSTEYTVNRTVSVINRIHCYKALFEIRIRCYKALSEINRIYCK